MPFSVLIIEKHPVVKEGLTQFFGEQFSEDDDLIIAVSKAAEFNMAHLVGDKNFDLIVHRFPAFPQDSVRNALADRSLFRASFYESTGNRFEDHMLSCHSGDVTVAIDASNWGEQLARKAKEFLCSQLVNGGLDAIFNRRDYRYRASPYEKRFKGILAHGRGLTHALAELRRTIAAYWHFLDERTQSRVRERFNVSFDREIGGQKYQVYAVLR